MNALQITWTQYRAEMNPFIVRMMGWVGGEEERERESRARMDRMKARR